MKKLLMVVAVLAVLVVGVGIAVYAFKDQAVKAVMERGGTYALGTPVHVQAASLDLGAGNLTVDGINVDNPQGFDKAQHITEIDQASVQIQTATLGEDLMVVDHTTVDGLRLNLEMDKNNQANFQPILKRLQSLAGDQPKEEKAPSDTKIKIGLVRISDLVVTLRMDNLGGGMGERVLKLPDFEVKNVGGDAGQPPEEVQATLTKAVLQHIKDSAGDLLPQVMLAGLQTGLDNLAGLGDVTVESLGGAVETVTDELGPAIEKANETFQKLGEEAGKAAEKVGQELDKAGKKVEEGLNEATEGLNNALKGLNNPFGKKETN